MSKRKSANDDFWDAVVGKETGGGRCPHCGSDRMTVESHTCQSCGRDERTPVERAKPALSPAVRKQPDVARALLDMDCTGEDDLAF